MQALSASTEQTRMTNLVNFLIAESEKWDVLAFYVVFVTAKIAKFCKFAELTTTQ